MKSERDTPLRSIGRGITAQSIMTPRPITVSPHDTVEDADTLFYENDIRHLPVVDEGKLMGILSERDIRGFSQSVPELGEDPETWRTRRRTPIQAIYKSDFIALGPEAELEEIIECLVDEKVGAIPIVQPHDMRLVGIISYIDVLKRLQNLSDLPPSEARLES